jgi:hypothetical protein
MNNYTSVLVLFSALLYSSCAPTDIMRTWSTTNEYDNKFSKIMVIGLAEEVRFRSDLESVVVDAARQINLSANKGINMFPPELGKPFDDIERVKTRLREKGFDGILTVTVIDIKEERYIKQELNYEPLVYYDRFRNYYYKTYDLVYRPGYFSINSSYFIEANFYELSDGHLVWTGRSRVLQVSEIDPYLPIYGKALFKELRYQNIISL